MANTVRKKLVSAGWVNGTDVHKAGDTIEMSEYTFKSAVEGGVKFEEVTTESKAVVKGKDE